MISIRTLAGGCATLLLFCSSAARAQFDMPQMWVGDTAVSSAVLKNGIDQALRSKRRDERPTVGKTSAAPQAASVSFGYKPSLVRRGQNLARFVARTRTVDPVGADIMAAAFAAEDMVAQISRAMPRWGLRPDNLAHAYALYWASAWLGSRGRNDDLPKPQMQAIRRQAEVAILSTNALGGADDAARQQMSEAMLIQSAMISQHVEHAKGKPAALAEVKRAVITGARAMGLDVANMTLTPDGFRLVK